MSTGKAAAGHGISGFFPGRIAGRGGPLPGCPAQHPAADRLYYSRMACTETNISLYIVAFRLCANFALWPLFAQRLFERCMVKKVVCVQDDSPLSESCTQQKAPPTEGKVSTGLAGMSLFRNGQKAAQSSALSSRLPSFLACSTTAGTSISGRIS